MLIGAHVRRFSADFYVRSWGTPWKDINMVLSELGYPSERDDSMR